ncbi:hypothetical protein [Myxococcus qinghaiensis]|uniref:hypothetical protein n=1 Tax=Myxococcus qinghaiensis TaxID=2906758 RepID=UPI0020A6ED92|nr:hypothetical protein [Myxococcus qinghaiensis]MCP3163300.1 hypothetical protein [Myxococcus qinghaiensis]
MSPPSFEQAHVAEASTGEAPATPSFAEYLARRLMVDKGFEPGTHPEAVELVDAADAVLTYSDGYSCVIMCIVDREREHATPPGTRWAGAVSVVALGAVGVSVFFAVGFREGW